MIYTEKELFEKLLVLAKTLSGGSSVQPVISILNSLIDDPNTNVEEQLIEVKRLLANTTQTTFGKESNRKEIYVLIDDFLNIEKTEIKTEKTETKVDEQKQSVDLLDKNNDNSDNQSTINTVENDIESGKDSIEKGDVGKGSVSEKVEIEKEQPIESKVVQSESEDVETETEKTETEEKKSEISAKLVEIKTKEIELTKELMNKNKELFKSLSYVVGDIIVIDEVESVLVIDLGGDEPNEFRKIIL